ncbi:hypothetical protein GON26_18485 [Flavobacterium sp. GA093]|uniref:Cystatin domain-containing protein n=1 Tax=Flavobacterium hydrocarbonoxydans TaxID=2683249 RepID=A0A6I4NV21_9FLAO|nr:hypothetical protein [Flavobacterium hydrocarbonoxydans]MWB96355.1 hypothetical protein [Flavobacterium hydrocarbonoxydans]
MSNNVQTNNETILGSWSVYNILTAEDLAIFKGALEGLLGVKYNPTAVSTQIVAGTNYRFRATATVNLSGLTYEVIVEIYKPLSGRPHLVSITPY